MHVSWSCAMLHLRLAAPSHGVDEQRYGVSARRSATQAIPRLFVLHPVPDSFQPIYAGDKGVSAAPPGALQGLLRSGVRFPSTGTIRKPFSALLLPGSRDN